MQCLTILSVNNFKFAFSISWDVFWSLLDKYFRDNRVRYYFVAINLNELVLHIYKNIFGLISLLPLTNLTLLLNIIKDGCLLKYTNIVFVGQSAIFNFQSLLTVILLLICTCTYIRSLVPNLFDKRLGKIGWVYVLECRDITKIHVHT